MKYRVQVDVAFDDLEEAHFFWDEVKSSFNRGAIKDISKEEKFSGNIHKCFHDEPENKPCEPMDKILSMVKAK